MDCQPLSALEAYQAGQDDVAAARAAALSRAVSNPGKMTDSEYKRFYLEALTALWQERIDRGELPPVIEKAS